MSVSKKFFLTLFIISIVPLLVAGFIIFQEVQKEVTSAIYNELDAVAGIQEHRINEKIATYLQNLYVISKDPYLQSSIKRYIDTDTIGVYEDINKRLFEIIISNTLIENVAIYGSDGNLVLKTEDFFKENISNTRYFNAAKSHNYFDDLVTDENNLIKVRTAGPLYDHLGDFVGVVEVISDGSPLIAVTQDYAGLGNTGEILLAKRNNAGDAVFLTPLRFDVGAALQGAIPRERDDIPVIPAVYGHEGLLTADFVDYRGEPVFAASRFIESMEWGVVVKINKKEALASMKMLTQNYIVMLLIAILIIAIASFFFTQTITGQIKNLTLFAQNLKAGNFSMRTGVKANDEIGFLADTFNDMANKLEGLYKNLEDQVRDRTSQLESEKNKLKESKENLSEAEKIGHMGSFVYDIEKDKVEFSNQSYWLHELEPNTKQIISAQDFIDSIPEDSRKQVMKELKKAIKKQDHSFEYEIIKKDGLKRYIKVISKKKINPYTKKEELKGVFQDITKQKKVEIAKSDFVSLASHQLRTPLTAINWYSELLSQKTGRLRKDQKKYIEQIIESGQRMSRLVNDLLNISRIETGRLSVDIKEIDLEKMVKEIVNEVEPLAQKHECEIIIKNKIKKPILKTDEILTQQVINNLVTNAVKYSRDEAKCYVEIELVEEKNRYVVSVADSGIGIPKSEQENIFTKFYRSTNARLTETDGTGLGLYTAKMLSAMLGGEIWFKSKNGSGTTFYYAIPKKAPESVNGEVSYSSIVS